MTGKPFQNLALQLRAAVGRRAEAMEKTEHQIRQELGWEEERWDEALSFHACILTIALKEGS